LLITRQLLALHAGSTLRLCSCGPGTGTTFKMQLNLERALHEAATDQPAGARRASAAQLALVAVAAAAHASADVAPGRAARMPPGFRCLYVDDDAFLQLTLPPRLFDPHAIEYDCASDGEEALRLVLEEGRRYDLILIDSQMPRMNGTLCVRALRAAGFAGAIIGMTGDPLGCPEREEFDAAGLSKSLSKDSGGIVAVLKTLADIADDYNASACTRL
jgi:CheY-like chemotaxis protein